MRLNIEMLRRAPQFTNTMLQREIDLRGLNISMLDANALLQLYNSFDVVNLSNNSLATLDSFPSASHQVGESRKNFMTRVSTLIAHKNKIQKVSVETCVRALPAVKYFYADFNSFATACDLVFLHFWDQLETVSLQGNPVWYSNPEGLSEEEVRAFLCFLCPKLRLINNNRVTQKDRAISEKNKEKFEEFLSNRKQINGAAGGRKTRKRGRDKAEANSSIRENLVLDKDEKERRILELTEKLNAEDLSAEALEELDRQIAELQDL